MRSRRVLHGVPQEPCTSHCHEYCQGSNVDQKEEKVSMVSFSNAISYPWAVAVVMFKRKFQKIDIVLGGNPQTYIRGAQSTQKIAVEKKKIKRILLVKFGNANIARIAVFGSWWSKDVTC